MGLSVLLLPDRMTILFLYCNMIIYIINILKDDYLVSILLLLLLVFIINFHNQVKEETACAVKLYSQLEEKQKEIRGDKLQQVISELAEAESKELISLPLSELDKLSQAANKVRSALSRNI